MVLFGSCVWHSKVDPNLYDKQNIVDVINTNYAKQPHRNKWSETPMHQSYKDPDNEDMIEPDLQSLIPVYTDKIKEFLIDTKVGECEFEFELMNYTVINQDQYMQVHAHVGDADFACVHYVSYDPEAHYPLVFFNEYPGYKWLKEDIVSKKILPNSFEHSIYFEKWAVPIQEDDIFIFPAHLHHGVENYYKTTKIPSKNRICVVANIKVV